MKNNRLLYLIQPSSGNCGWMESFAMEIPSKCLLKWIFKAMEYTLLFFEFDISSYEQGGRYQNVEFTPRSIFSCCRKLSEVKLILEWLICELEISIFILCLFVFVFFYIYTKSKIMLPMDNITEAMIYN